MGFPHQGADNIWSDSTDPEKDKIRDYHGNKEDRLEAAEQSIASIVTDVAALQGEGPNPAISAPQALDLIQRNGSPVVQTIDVTGQASVVVSAFDPTVHAGLIIHLVDLKSANADATLCLRTSTDGVNFDGGFDHYSTRFSVAVPGDVTTNTTSEISGRIPMTSADAGNAADLPGVTGTVNILRPDLVARTPFIFELGYSVTGGALRSVNGYAVRQDNAGVTDFQLFFDDGDFSSGHIIVQSIPAAVLEDVTDAVPGLIDQLAPKASPQFTGSPTAPTQAQASNDGSIATTAFVNTAVGALNADSVGLSNVDNTADADKPISEKQQAALDGKSDAGHSHRIDTLSEGGGKVIMTTAERQKLDAVNESADVTDSASVGRAFIEGDAGDENDLSSSDVIAVMVNVLGDRLSPVSLASFSAFLMAELDHTQNADLVEVLAAKASLVDGVVPFDQLPSSLAGGLVYQGVWDASVNLPAIPAAHTDNAGHQYIVGVAGTTDIDGGASWVKGDLIVSNGVKWEKIEDNADELSAAAPYLDNLQYTLHQSFQGHGPARQYILVGKSGGDDTVSFGRINLKRDGSEQRFGHDAAWTTFVMPNGNTSMFYYADLTTGDILETSTHALAQDTATVAFLGAARRGKFSNATGLPKREPYQVVSLPSELDAFQADDFSTGDLVQVGANQYEVAPESETDPHYVNASGLKFFEAGERYTSVSRFVAATQRGMSPRVGDVYLANGIPFRYTGTNHPGAPAVGFIPDNAVSPLHWGAFDQATYSSSTGIATGDDASTAFNASLDYMRTLLASGDQSQLPEWSASLGRLAKYRISNPVNVTGFGSAAFNRLFPMEFRGTTCIFDCGPRIGMDFTGSEYWDAREFFFIGSKLAGATPLFGVKAGRVSNNNAAGKWSMSLMKSHDTTASSRFLKAAVWNVGCEDIEITGCEFANNGTTGTEYGYAHDNVNGLAYAGGLHAIESVSDASPAVITTVEDHNLTTGKVIVFADAGVANDKNPNHMLANSDGVKIEGQAWTITVTGPKTWTMSNTDSGVYNGAGYVDVPGLVYAVEEFLPSEFIGDVRHEPCKEISDLVGNITRNKFTARYGKAAVYIGNCEQLRIDNNFLKAPVGFHLMATARKSNSDLNMAGSDIDVHVEADGDVEKLFLIEPLSSYAAADFRFGGGVLREPGMGAKVLFDLGEGIDKVSLHAMDVKYTRPRDDHEFLVSGGKITARGCRFIIPTPDHNNADFGAFRDCQINYTKDGTTVDTNFATFYLDDSAGNDSSERIPLGSRYTLIKDNSTITANRNRLLESEVAEAGDVAEYWFTGVAGGDLQIKDNTSSALLYEFTEPGLKKFHFNGTAWEHMG